MPTEADSITSASNVPIPWYISIPPVWAALLMYASSLETARSIKADRTVGNRSPFPLFVQLLNATLWLSYGVLLADFPLVAPSIFGIGTSIYSLTMFRRYAGAKTREHTQMMAATLGLFILTSMVAMNGDEDSPIYVFGNSASAISVCLSMSPLVSLRTLLRTGDTRAMPFCTSVSMWLSGALWFMYGYYTYNWHVMLPNAINFLGASTQLAVLAYVAIRRQSPADLEIGRMHGGSYAWTTRARLLTM